MDPLAITTGLATAETGALGAFTSFVGWFLARRVQEVHVLTNSNLATALAKITELEAMVVALQPPPPPPPAP